MERPWVGVGVLIEKNEQWLLLKRKGSHGEGTWAPPGGHLEFQETFSECACREALEEVGVHIKNPELIGVTNDFFGEKHYVTIWMKSSHYSGSPHLCEPEKAKELAWFSKENLPNPLFLSLENFLRTKK